MAVHRIRPPNNGDGDAAVFGTHGSFIKTIRQRQPVFYRGVFVLAGERATAVENGAERIFSDIGRRHIAQLRLNELTHFLLQAHLAQQLGNARLYGGVFSHFTVDFWPKL